MKSYIEEAADFISKDCKRMKAGKLKEGRYQTVDDELNAVINGGWDDFEADEDLVNPEKADAIHKNAQATGMSDLDYVNREEALDSIEDDWAYELETQDYFPTASDVSEVINNSNIRDVYDEEAASIADKGFANGSYGSQIKNGPTLLEDIMEGIVQYIGDELPRPSYDYTSSGQKVIQEWLDASAKYVGNPVTPKCEAFHNGLVVLAQEYNTVLKDVLGNPEWPEPIIVPAVNGRVNESTKGDKIMKLNEDWDDDDGFPCEICGKESEDVMEPGEMFEFDDYMDYEDGSMQSKVSKCATKLVSNDTEYTSTMMCPDCFEKLFWNRAKAMCSPKKRATESRMKKPTLRKKINEATGLDMNLTARIKIGSGWSRDDETRFVDELRVMIERPGESIDFRFPSSDEIKLRVHGFAQAEDVLEYSFETAKVLGLSIPVKVSFEI